MISSKQKCCLLLNGVSTESQKLTSVRQLRWDFSPTRNMTRMLDLINRESKTYLCTSVKAGFFSNKKYDSYKCWSCSELCEAFTFLMENIYVQFDDMVYQQIVGIPIGTNCAPLIPDLFFILLREGLYVRPSKAQTF